MKETGLMFKAPLVRSILDDSKTQTRRLVKPAPAADQPLQHINTETGLVYARSMEQIDSRNIRPIRWESPVGQPGDRIYVRETFAQHPRFADLAYRAEGEEFEDSDGFLWEPKWTPAIHMPKALARIWLEVTGVRVERLQGISEADAKAEGSVLKNSPAAHLTSYRRGFQELWESTGGDWAANPWVWVTDFKRIEKP